MVLGNRLVCKQGHTLLNTLTIGAAGKKTFVYVIHSQIEWNSPDSQMRRKKWSEIKTPTCQI